MRKFIALILLAAIILPSFLTGFAGEQEYSIYHDVLHCECQYTAKELAYGLKYELVDDAKDYIAAKEKYGICPIYNAAKDALESGWGRYAIRNNLGGVTTDKAFSSHAEFIDWWSAFQLEHYLLQDGKYHTGGTAVADINKRYNGAEFWEENVALIMQQIVADIEANKPKTVVVEF